MIFWIPSTLHTQNMQHTPKLPGMPLTRMILYFVAIVCAGPAMSQTMTLDDAIALALKNNFDIRLAKADSTSKALDKSFSYTVFLPTLNATASKVWTTNNQRKTYSGQPDKIGNGIRSNNLQAGLALNWTLFDGLNMFATREKLAEIQNFGALNVKNKVINAVANVSNTYYNIVQQKQQLKAIEEEITVNEERVKLADKKFSVGLGAKPELLQAKVDLNAEMAIKLQQQTLIVQLKEQLNQLIGEPIGANYEVMDTIPINLELKLDDIQKGIETSNLSLLLAKKNIDISKISLKQARALYFPMLGFTSNYNFLRTTNQAVVDNFTPLFNQNKGLNYGFTATVPIFNGFNARRQTEQAKLFIGTEQLVYDSTKARIDLSIMNAYQNYEYARQSLQLEEDNIGLAKENVSIALEVYRHGASTFLDLRVAQTSLDSAYSRLIAARYNTKLAETELLRLKGQLVR
jgi:outer membrane protein